jgi:octopine oxidase subunit A
MIQDRYEVAVVGAGPAGMAAASLCARAGLSTVVFDRRPVPGGCAGSAGEKIGAAFLASGAVFVPGAEVGSLTPEGELAVRIQGGAHRVHAIHVVLAPGAIERPFVIPGSTLPGVAMAGSAGLPAGRTVIAGSGPYLWALAARLLDAGAQIEAILDTTPRANRAHARRHVLPFLLAAHFRAHRALVDSLRRRVRVIQDVTALRADGASRFERAIWGSDSHGHKWESDPHIEADNLLLHWGVVPDVALAAAMGLEKQWDETRRCWVPVVSAFGASSVPGIYVVGEGAGVAGAQAAPWHGTLAAADIVHTVRPELAKPAATLARSALARFARGRRYLDVLYRPEAVEPPEVLHATSAKTASKVGEA